MTPGWKVICAAAGLAAIVAAPGAAALVLPESERLSRAKDLIADEQWRRAIVELRAATADPKEPAKDEAAFWLAHSLYQAGDAAASLETIAALERDFPRSRWLHPARSLKLEIAHRLNRSELLWRVAAPPVPPAPPAAPTPATTATPAPAPPPPAPPPPAPPAPRVAPVPTVQPVAPRRRTREWVRAPHAGEDTAAIAEEALILASETDLRIQALGSLMRVEPARAVPILKEVALNAGDGEQARRAIFVLMQSNRRDAQAAIGEIARTGPESVTVAAVRELGLVRTPYSSRLLRDLYGSGSERVKTHVIHALGQAGESQRLLQIARAEASRPLRETAIVALGRAGARTELDRLYRTFRDRATKETVITALFTAAGEDELRRIAREERDGWLKQIAAARLELLVRR